MTKYAEDSQVPADRSRAEIERILQRWGASSFLYGWQSGHKAVIAFEMSGRRYRFVLPLPKRDDKAFRLTPTGLVRTQASAQGAYDQAIRQRWRALALVIKATLEAVESGITTLEEAFLSATVLPDDTTVGETLAPQITEVYRTGRMDPLVPLLGSGS